LSSVVTDCLAVDSAVWELIARNWALVSIATTIVLLVVVPAAVLRRYVRIMTNLMDDTHPPLSRGVHDSGRIDGEPVSFLAHDGHHLTGTFIWGNSAVARRGMIIFAHEFKSDRHSALRYCRPLLEAGYDVFSFDFRGHGDSPPESAYKPRQWPTDREMSDMLGAIAYVGDYLQGAGRGPEIGLFGISRGAGAAILAAARLSCVTAIVADGAFSSDTIIEYYMKRWATIFAKVRVVAEFHPAIFWTFLRWLLFGNCSRKFNCRFPSVRKTLRQTQTPILLIHGEKDPYIPYVQSQMLHAEARERRSEKDAWLWLVPGAKHNHSVALAPELYGLRTRAFFDVYLAGIAVADDVRAQTGLSELTHPIARPPRRGAHILSHTRRPANSARRL